MPLFENELLPSSSQKVGINSIPSTSGAAGPVPQPVIPSYFEGGDIEGNNLRVKSLQDIVDSYDANKDYNPKPNDIQQGITNKELKDNDRYKIYKQGVNNEDIYASNQSGWDELGNAAVNLVAKTIAYTSQAAGFILGAPAALVTQDMSNMTDNFLVKAGDYLKEGVQKTNPIYKPDTYTNGNIWSKLTTSQWWLDDFVDRAALTISMFVPGIAETKGLGLFGTAVDASGALKSTGLISKGIENIGANIEKSGDFAKLFLPKLYKAATTGVIDDGVNPALAAYARNLTKAELYSWNVIGQSALNAKETGDGIKRSLQEARDRGENFFTDEEIDNKASDGRSAAFWETVPVTLASSLVELPQMFSTARGAKSLFNKIYNSETGEQLIQSANQLIPSFKSTVGKALLTGFEHGQSESLQVAISRYNEDRLTGKDVRGTIEGIFGDFIDNINDPNGQNNIALGTIQGILTTAGGRVMSRAKGEDSHTIYQANSIMQQVAASKLAMRYYNTDFVAKDNTGKVITDSNGKVQLDQQKLADAGVSLADMQDKIQQRAQAIHEGDFEKLSELNHNSITAISRNFFDDPNGIEHLKGIMAIEAKAAKTDVNRIHDLDEYGNEISIDQQHATNLEIVDKAKKIYDAIDQRHAGFMHFNIDSKDKIQASAAQQIISELKEAQYKEGTNQVFITDALAKNTRALTSIATINTLGTTEKISKPSSPAEQQINDLINKREELVDRLEQSKVNYKELIDRKAQTQYFKDKMDFINSIKDTVDKQKETTSEEHPSEIDQNHIDNINNASSTLKEWVDKAKDSPVIEDIVNKHKDILDKYTGDGNIEQLTQHPEELHSLVNDINDNFTEPDDKKNIAPVLEALNKLDEYNKQLEAQNELKTNTELNSKLNKLQTTIQKKSGDTSTGDPNVDITKMPKEQPKKALYELTHSTTEPSESKDRKPFHDRHQSFLTNFSSLPNKSTIQAIKITKNNEEDWGLKGLVDSVKFGDITDEQLIDPKLGTVLIVYVNKNSDGTYSLIDKNGKTVKDNLINNAVYATMGSADKNWIDGTPRYRNTEKPEDVENTFKKYEEDRAKVFDINTKDNTQVFNFNIADGRPIFDENPQAKNPVLGSIITDYRQLSDKGLVQVSTTGTISDSKGQNLSIPKGRPVLVTSSGVSFLNNRNFSPSEATNITNVLKQLAREFNETQEFNADIVRYLQGILQWKTPTINANPNQMYIDGITGELKLGSNILSPFHPDAIESNRDKIKDILQRTYNNVNNTFLTTEFESPFNELSIDKDGKTTTTKWKTYQHFLLSPKLSNGQNRTGLTPLYTRVRMLQKGNVVENDYNFLRYSVLEDLETPKINEKEKAKETQTPKDNKRSFTDSNKGTTEARTITLGGGENVSFTVGKDGAVSLIDGSELNKAIERIKTLEPEMTNAKEQLPGQSDDIVAATIIKNNIEGRLSEITTKPEAIVETPTTTKPNLKERIAQSKKNAAENTKEEKSNYSTISSLAVRRMYPEEHTKFNEWMSKNLPNVPVERVKTIIEKTGGGYAWGVFENGMIKLFENAAYGTEYHEAFEAVWNSFVDENEQKSIINEYKAKNKSTTLSDDLIKEKIADKFSEYILTSDQKGLGGRIIKFFHDLISFFKSLISKPGATEQLFNKINTGYYSSRQVNNGVDAAYNSIPGLSQQVLNETINHITASIFRDLSEDTSNFFDLNGVLSSKLFSVAKNRLENRIDGIVSELDDLLQKSTGEEAPIKAEIESYFDIKDNIDKHWNGIIEQVKEYLSAFNIKINEEDDVIDFNDDNRSNIDFKQDTFKTDVKSSASTAIKLLFATLTNNIYETTTIENGKVLNLPEETYSPTIQGMETAQFGKSFIQVLDAVANNNTIDGMVDDLVNIAKKEPNLVKLFTRLRGSVVTGKIDYSKLNDTDWRLLISFFNTMSRQQPTALIQYVGDDGHVYIQNADLNDVISNTVSSWIPKIKEKVNINDGFIKFSKGNYSIDKKSLTAVNNYAQQLSFLNRLGIPFSKEEYNILVEKDKTIDKIQDRNIPKFASAVSSIRGTLATLQASDKLTQKWLNVKGPLNTLSSLLNSTTTPEPSSILFGGNNEKRQKYVLNNYISVFANDFNSVKTIKELYQKFPYLKDVFSQNSLILKEGGYFFDEDGNKTNKTLKIGYIDSEVNNNTGKVTGISKLLYGRRLMVELNSSLLGWSYNLSAGDAGTEWMINVGNQIPLTSFNSKEVWNDIFPVFNGYLRDEINLVLENRTNNKNIKAKADRLRFLSNILPASTSSLIESAIKKGTIDDYLDKKDDVGNLINQNRINNEIKISLEKRVESLKNTLLSNNEIIIKGNSFLLSRLAQDKKLLSETELNNLLSYTIINHVISSIELHKLFYGDPYQFKITYDKAGRPTLDETKRIKSGSSSKELPFNNIHYDNFANREKNKVGKVSLTHSDVGHTSFKPYANTITLSDIIVKGQYWDDVDETDACAVGSLTFIRQMELKRGRFSPLAESAFQYQMAKARKFYDSSDVYEYMYSSKELEEADDEILSHPQPEYVFPVIKPLAFGPKYDKTFNDLLMDKYSIVPLTFDIAEFAGDNMKDFFYKMHFDKAEDGNSRDYAVTASGRKVGNEGEDKLYGDDGRINKEPFTFDVKVDLNHIGYQLETSYSEGKKQRIGKQSRKMVTMDIFDAGVPIGWKREDWNALTEDEKLKSSDLYKKVKDYDKTVNRMKSYGNNNILKNFGIIDKGDRYQIEDYSILAETLRKEIIGKRLFSDNVKKSIQLGEDGRFPVPFEATNVYKEIKSVINSIINDNLISQKVNGAPHVQVSSTLFEMNNRQAAYKTKDGYKPVEDYNILTEAEKKTVVLTSNELKMYTTETNNDGKITKVNHMEVYLPRWFKNNSKLSDKELLDYLNNTEEGQKVLKGIGFRIPTQAKNSIEAFIVKGFLPASMGHSIVLPSEITKKTGSDYDIDKLNTYLKNVSFDKNGLPFVSKLDIFDTNDEEKLKDFYETHLREDYKKFKSREAVASSEESVDDLFSDIFKKSVDEEGNEKINTNYENIEDSLVNELKRNYIPSFEEFLAEVKGQDIYKINEEYNSEYKKIIENEFFQATEDLVLHPELFDRLMKPNEQGGKLREYRDDIIKAIGDDSGISYPDMTSMEYKAKMRHNASSAEGGIGIVASTQTMYANLQRVVTVLSDDNLSSLTKKERDFLTNIQINLTHNTIIYKGKPHATLSALKDKEGRYISDNLSNMIDGMVDITKDPFITELLGDNSNVHSTFILLTLLGVKTKTSSYFINQPIIREYLKTLSANGISGLFDLKTKNNLLLKFAPGERSRVATRINEGSLLNNIQKYYKTGLSSLTNDEKSEQMFILNEFLKYAAIAQHLYPFNSATSYDDKLKSNTTFDNKKARTNKERNKNIISSVDDVLNNTFMGELSNTLDSTHNALSEVFPTFKNNIRNILNSVRQSIDSKYMKSKTREAIDVGVESSFIDFIIQTGTGYTKDINKLLIDVETAVSSKLSEVQAKYNNVFLNSLAQINDDKELLNVKLDKRDEHVFDTNLYISAFRELKQQDRELYFNLIKLNILQSSTQNSKLSYTHLIPIEDYRIIAGDIISKLDINTDVSLFKDNFVFFRNNWKNNDIVPTVKTNYRSTDNGYTIDAYDRVPTSIKALGDKTGIKFIQVHPDFGNKAAYPVVKTISYEKDSSNGKSTPIISLYQRVMRDENTPLISQDRNSKDAYIYKQINAWGKSFYLQEYYKNNRQSQIDNSTQKVNEISDEDVLAAYDKTIKPQAVVETINDNSNNNFQEYKGGFENIGKGTPQGDGKDKAMRQVAGGVIVELFNPKSPSSSRTSLEQIAKNNEFKTQNSGKLWAAVGKAPGIVMLARNSEFKGKDISVYTKQAIDQVHENGGRFIVGDMPNVDSQFIDYLQQIGAKFTIYHTGNSSRININKKDSSYGPKELPLLQDKNTDNC